MFLQAEARTQSCHTIYAWGWADRANKMHFEALSESPKRSHVVIKMVTVQMLKDAGGHGCQAGRSVVTNLAHTTGQVEL